MSLHCTKKKADHYAQIVNKVCELWCLFDAMQLPLCTLHQQTYHAIINKNTKRYKCLTLSSVQWYTI